MRVKHRMASSLAVFALAFFANAPSAFADFTFSASNGSGLSASVNFNVVGGNLIVTLTNTSSSDVTVPAQILTAVFFSLPGSLTPVSAEVASGSWVNNEPQAGADEFPNIGGEWAYESGLNVGGSNSGISSAGFDIFGGDGLFGSPNLAGPNAVNGMGYGITSAGDDATTGNNAILSNPFVQNSVVFVLSGWDSDWSLSDITNIWFQYGTSMSEPNLGVPEPGTIALLTLGLLGLVFGVRKLSWV